MNFLEKDLEDIIFYTPNKLLNERGLPINGKKLRQVKLDDGTIADIITIERDYPNVIITVWELKKDNIGFDALSQALGYADCIHNWLHCNKKIEKYIIKIALIGDICDSDMCALSRFTDIRFYEYVLSYDGIWFDFVDSVYNSGLIYLAKHSSNRFMEYNIH